MKSAGKNEKKTFPRAEEDRENRLLGSCMKIHEKSGGRRGKLPCPEIETAEMKFHRESNGARGDIVYPETETAGMKLHGQSDGRREDSLCPETETAKMKPHEKSDEKRRRFMYSPAGGKMKPLKQENSNQTGGKERAALLLNLLNDKRADERLLEWGGRLALENENWKIAERIFACLLERRRKAEDLTGLGQALFRQKRLEEAEECFLAALNCITAPCPLLFIVYTNLGHICLRSNNLETAEEYYNKAHTLNPHSPSLQFHKARLHLKTKDFKAAETGFKNFLQKEPDSPNAWLGLALSRKGLKEQVLALACLEQCLDLDPENKPAKQFKNQWIKTDTRFTGPEFAFTP